VPSRSRFGKQGEPTGDAAYPIAWWNLENLFDQENAVAHRRRTDKVFRAIKNDIAVEVDEMADLDPTAFAGIDWRWRSGGLARWRRFPVKGCGATVMTQNGRTLAQKRGRPGRSIRRITAGRA